MRHHDNDNNNRPSPQPTSHIHINIHTNKTGATFASWAMTLVVMGGCTALLFAQGVYAPCADLRGNP